MTLKTLYKLTQNIIRENKVQEQKKQLENTDLNNNQDNKKSVTKTFNNSVYTKLI